MKIFSKPIVLNAGEPSQIPSEQAIDVALTLAMADLKAHFIDTEKGVVRYKEWQIQRRDHTRRNKRCEGRSKTFRG